MAKVKWTIKADRLFDKYVLNPENLQRRIK